MFTSHILSDVELLCDRVVIMQRGEIASEGHVHDLLETSSRRVEVRLSGASIALKTSLASRGVLVDEGDGHLTLRVVGDKAVDEILRIANAAGARLDALIPERQTLEALFLQDAAGHAAPKKPPSSRRLQTQTRSLSFQRDFQQAAARIRFVLRGALL